MRSHWWADSKSTLLVGSCTKKYTHPAEARPGLKANSEAGTPSRGLAATGTALAGPAGSESSLMDGPDGPGVTNTRGYYGVSFDSVPFKILELNRASELSIVVLRVRRRGRR